MARILLVDDELKVLEPTAKLLKLAGGHKVTVAISPEEGLQILQQQGCDVLITDKDFTCPGSAEGVALAVRAREYIKNLPVVMFSGLAYGMQKPEGVDRLIEKPFKITELEEAVQEAIKMHQTPSQ